MGTLAGERGGGESPNSDDGIYTVVVLYIYKYFVGYTVQAPTQPVIYTREKWRGAVDFSTKIPS
jgi:hypothetical protein